MTTTASAIPIKGRPTPFATMGTGRACSICSERPLKRNVDAMLDEGVTSREIRARYALGNKVLLRHKKHWQQQRAVMNALHKPLPPEPDAPVTKHRPRLTKEDILDKASDIIYDADDLFKAAKASGVIKDASRALEGVRRSVELVGKFEGLGLPGPTTVIDQRQVTILETISKLSLDEMRAIYYQGQPQQLSGDLEPTIDYSVVAETSATTVPALPPMSPEEAAPVQAEPAPAGQRGPGHPPTSSAKLRETPDHFKIEVTGVRGLDATPFTRYFRDLSKCRTWELQKRGIITVFKVLDIDTDTELPPRRFE